jgi:hypothetical protein
VIEIASTNGISRFPLHPRSPTIFATTLVEVTKVIPPRNSAGISPHPSRRPASTPGPKLSTRFRAPAGSEVRIVENSSSAVYSRPNVNRSRTRPISDPVRANSWVAPSGTNPPSPSARPATR